MCPTCMHEDWSSWGTPHGVGHRPSTELDCEIISSILVRAVREHSCLKRIIRMSPTFHNPESEPEYGPRHRGYISMANALTMHRSVKTQITASIVCHDAHTACGLSLVHRRSLVLRCPNPCQSRSWNFRASVTIRSTKIQILGS